MSNRSACSTSFWMATQDMPEFPPLTMENAPAHVDVCVVGAGIAGLTTAYLLQQRGKRVVVIDDGEVGGGVTGRTTGHLTYMLDDRYYELERLHGEHGARIAAESHCAAIDRIEKIVQDEGIDCEFERVEGYLFVPPGESPDVLARELEAAWRAGLRDVERLERAPLFDTGACLHFPRQAQFHALKYLNQLARILVRAGAHIFGHTHIVEVADGAPARVVSEDGVAVTADAVVVATHTPINDRVAMHTKQMAYRTYVVGLPLPKPTAPRGLLWDTGDPYHYVRLAPFDATHDLLIVGGEDHKTGQADDSDARYARLEAWARQRFPAAGAAEFRWSGQIMEPVDGLAFIGRNPRDKNVYIATGDSGNGLTHATIAGMLIADLVTGEDNPWADLFNPARKSLRATGEYVKENVNTAAQYLHWAKGGEVKSAAEIPPGEGAVLRQGVNHFIAVYRDERNRLQECSAVCTHLGCIVQWNGAEKTWDCPCHGSRFDCLGQVVNGPAVRHLQPIVERRRERRG